jgi:hypothetical protein
MFVSVDLSQCSSSSFQEDFHKISIIYHFIAWSSHSSIPVFPSANPSNLELAQVQEYHQSQLEVEVVAV